WGEGQGNGGGCGKGKHLTYTGRHSSRSSRQRQNNRGDFPRARHGATSRRDGGKHLLLFQLGQQGARPTWRQVGQSLQYERDFAGGLHMLARATIEDDGVLLRYEFENQSKVAYEMIYAPSDPRLTSIFHDVRLQRTYVQHKAGFE